MNFWYWYVLAVSALSLAGYITINILLTLLLAVLVHVQFQIAASDKRFLNILKVSVIAAAALALLWRESFLPPASTIISFLADPATRPTAEYLAEFLRQSLNIPMLAAALALFAAVCVLSRKRNVRFIAAVYIILAGAWIMQPKQPVALGAGTPEAFFKSESGRVVDFPAPAAAAKPFDIIILHICSLSWKDISDSGYDIKPFFSKFDYIFTDFSSASGYSKLATLHVLKSPCGQVPAARIFDDAPAGCYLMDDLRRSGYKTYTMFSHDGKYDDFETEVQQYGHADKALGIAGLTAAYHMFDGTLLYSDKAALDKFWKVRQASKAPRAAVYYNTVNLHIGTHKTGGYRGPDDAASYKERLAEMTGELDGFFAEVEKSGRSAVVVFVPEHGAALTGTKMQAKDVREIPLPPITIVPAAVKLIGKAFYAADKPQVITRPSSLQALAWLLAEFLRHDPYTREARKPETVAAEIPQTGFLAENYNAAVMRAGSGYIYRQKGGDWKPLPAYALIPPGTIPAPGDFKRSAK